MTSSGKESPATSFPMDDTQGGSPFASIIIVNYNGLAYTQEAVLSILKYSQSSEIIIVDNCSTDESAETLAEEFSSLKIISLNENRGFGYGCNRGAEAAKGKYLFFLNNDTLLTEDTPAILTSYLETNPTVAACGPKLLNRDGSFQVSFGLDPSLVNEWIVRRWQRPSKRASGASVHSLERRYAGAKVDWVTAAALMMRTDVFRQLDGFDETFFMYFEDADLCRRVRQLNYSVRYLTMTSVVHFRGQSAKEGSSIINREYRRSQINYYRKHRSPIVMGVLKAYLAVRPATK